MGNLDEHLRHLNVRTIINATGTFTRMGGTLMAPEVTAAMVEASKHFVVLEELQYAAGKFVAEITGAEAGYITSGAQAGLLGPRLRRPPGPRASQRPVEMLQ